MTGPCLALSPRRRFRGVPLFCAGVLAVLLAGCRLGSQGPLEGKASDEWTRSYTLAPDGEFQIVAADGTVAIETQDKDTIDVVAERIAHAVDDEIAADVVPRIQILEDVTPERIVLRTEGLGGIVIGVKVEVNYRVRVPARTKLRVRTVNGAITVSNVAGHSVISSTNGEVNARGLRGGLEARVVNGRLSAELASLGDDVVDLRSTNGSIDLAVPKDAAAQLSLNATNGRITVDDLPFDAQGDQTPRRVRGRMNGGGTSIEVNAMNGNVRVHPVP